MLGESLTPTHLVFVLVIALLIFGPRRIPGIGRAIREFRKNVAGSGNEVESEMRAKSPSGESAKLS
ncbi:MAG: twin-arginine translocase TatA/TatE family subunit [Thermoleophilia bacterium]|nr:twin-arginine translocase TatA/TatE family subunit [Thermoleophilia bacterium]